MVCREPRRDTEVDNPSLEFGDPLNNDPGVDGCKERMLFTFRRPEN